MIRNSFEHVFDNGRVQRHVVVVDRLLELGQQKLRAANRCDTFRRAFNALAEAMCERRAEKRLRFLEAGNDVCGKLVDFCGLNGGGEKIHNRVVQFYL